MIMFKAALEDRYAYQPPSWLSETLPTRAESVAEIARVSLRNNGRKCLATRAGPIVLIRDSF